MPIERFLSRPPLPARRVFRLALVVALTLMASYSLAIPMPYVAPIFALFLSVTPGRPLGLKSLIGILVLVLVTMGAGLLLVPVLVRYPSLGLILVALGIFVGTDLSVNRGKGPVGTFLCLGLTLITAAGVMDFYAALTVAKSLMKGIALAVLAQQVAYFFFPEDPVSGPAPAKPATLAKVSSNWIATRTTLIVFPAYLLGLINPTMYLPIIMKSLSLGQQSSVLNARNAGKELLDSTFLGGAFSMLFWFALKIQPNLLMFFLWMLVFAGFLAAKIYRIFPTEFPPSFWVNVAVTMIILLGPAVADSANGKDVYKAFAVRMALFVAVTVYAWAAIMVLENLRLWRLGRRSVPETVTEVS